MNSESLRNHLWVAKTAITDMVPFSGMFAKNRNGDPLYSFDYYEPVEFHSVGYYGNTMKGAATSELFRRLGIITDALAMGMLILGKLIEGTPTSQNAGIFAFVFGGLVWIWSKYQFNGVVRKNFHTDFQHEHYPYEKPKRKRKKKWVDRELVEIVEDE